MLDYTGIAARLALFLMKVMLVLFGILVWVPNVIRHPQARFNWSEVALNFLIAGATWTVVNAVAER